jgi:zinc transporter ZupT
MKKQVSKTQMGDQMAKGGVMGLVVYFANKGNVDPELLAICMPLIAGVMAFVSSKIGDPGVASFFDTDKEKDA